jgi:Domain of unknown function (DUF4266)
VPWPCTFRKGGPPGGLRPVVLVETKRAASASPLAPAAQPGKAGLRRHSGRLILALGLLLIGGGGCSTAKWTVKPHQRELLADRIMQLDGDANETAAEAHVLANREGAIGGTGTSGGGCGCN